MRLIRFDSDAGRPVHAFGSEGLVISPVLRGKGAAHVGCMHLAADGFVGRHEATEPQLFLCIAGEGWVEGEDGQRLPLQVGTAACWARGEPHAAGTEKGMVAIVVAVDEVTLMRLPERRQPDGQ